MKYCTKQDMIDRVGFDELVELTDEHHTGQIDDTKLDNAITDASALIDGYLDGVTDLPLPADIPVLLVRLCVDVVRYYLYDDAVTDLVQSRYDSAIKTLTAISKRDISLGLTKSGAKPVSDNSVEMVSDGRTFKRDNSFI